MNISQIQSFCWLKPGTTRRNVADGEVLEGGAGVVLNTQGVTTQLKTLLPLFRARPEMTRLLGEKARQRVLERYTLTQNLT